MAVKQLLAIVEEGVVLSWVMLHNKESSEQVTEGDGSRLNALVNAQKEVLSPRGRVSAGYGPVDMVTRDSARS